MQRPIVIPTERPDEAWHRRLLQDMLGLATCLLIAPLDAPVYLCIFCRTPYSLEQNKQVHYTLWSSGPPTTLELPDGTRIWMPELPAGTKFAPLLVLCVSCARVIGGCTEDEPPREASVVGCHRCKALILVPSWHHYADIWAARHEIVELGPWRWTARHGVTLCLHCQRELGRRARGWPHRTRFVTDGCQRRRYILTHPPRALPVIYDAGASLVGK